MSGERLAELLLEVKARSGRTYEALSRRTGMSRSTVHRYCRGEIVPDTFGPLERIARASGAGQGEVDELYRRWTQAVAAGATGATTGRDTAGAADMPGVPGVAGAVSAVSTASLGNAPAFDDLGKGVVGPDENRVHADRESAPDAARRDVASPPSGHAWVRRRPAVMASVLTVLCLALLKAGTPAASWTPSPPAQWISGPAWSSFPAPVPRTLFGVTMNSSTGTMPGFRVGAVRLWDSETRWAQLQPARGEFDWPVLDRLVAGGESAGLPVLFVLGGTPAWASPTGPAAPYPDGSRAAPPDDLADWDAFVRALVKRYRGRIEAYELWVLANDRRFYAGSVERLVEMTRRASGIIRAADPRATVVCPGMGQLWTPEGQRVLRRFAELGGYGHCDVASVKLYQRTASDPPESVLQLVTTIDRVLHEAGVQPPVWNTGTTYTIPLERPLDATRARDYAVRFFLTGLYARQYNVERMYFYNWGGTKIPIVLQADGGAPTRAALAVERLERWLAHAKSRSCGHGLAISLPENVWQCEFTITEPGGARTAVIRWAITGTADTTAGPKAQTVRRLDGGATAVRPGDTVTVTEEPILIEDRP
ncbi:cobalamin ABC transporter substrate-binding protein [Sphaerisporangium album]|uniref:Cobalamin ABC transporter substrate-binding protein n=1 Tax=Sphaerisporangium album TaxID=509200 RepID=A0A367FSA4_9ACTN|nr:helix-turn-helix domain-containing protein [Sphaerisporangium album]RCG33181.1 cobalamin ABC transporter substrate-binding protein [Sphaerisporangium album]